MLLCNIIGFSSNDLKKIQESRDCFSRTNGKKGGLEFISVESYSTESG